MCGGPGLLPVLIVGAKPKCGNWTASFNRLKFTRSLRQGAVADVTVFDPDGDCVSSLCYARYGNRHRVALTGKSFSRHANTVCGDTAKIPVSPGMAATRIPYLLL
jgi:hypothetical protein